MFTKTEMFRITYISIKDNCEKSCLVDSVAKKDEYVAKLKANGRFVSVVKLYPYSMEKNQHNFDLIANICSNRIHDMTIGELPYDEAECNRLTDLKEKAENLFCYGGGIAWLDYPTLVLARELANMAINHRANACIENGRPDLVRYCY